MHDFDQVGTVVQSEFEQMVHLEAFIWGCNKNEKAYFEGTGESYKVSKEQLYKDYWSERLG